MINSKIIYLQQFFSSFWNLIKKTNKQANKQTNNKFLRLQFTEIAVRLMPEICSKREKSRQLNQHRLVIAVPAPLERIRRVSLTYPIECKSEMSHKIKRSFKLTDLTHGFRGMVWEIESSEGTALRQSSAITQLYKILITKFFRNLLYSQKFLAQYVLAYIIFWVFSPKFQNK